MTLAAQRALMMASRLMYRVSLVLLPTASLPAQDTVAFPRGTAVRLQTRGDPTWIVGAASQITADVISFDTCTRCTGLTFPWSRIDRASVLVQRGLTKRRRLTVMLGASVVGAASGVAIGSGIGARGDRNCREGPFCGARREIFGGSLGVVGALAGLSFGAAWHRDRWRPLLRPEAR